MLCNHVFVLFNDYVNNYLLCATALSVLSRAVLHGDVTGRIYVMYTHPVRTQIVNSPFERVRN